MHYRCHQHEKQLLQSVLCSAELYQRKLDTCNDPKAFPDFEFATVEENKLFVLFLVKFD